MNITRREFTKKLSGLGVGSVLAFGGCGPRKEDKPPSATRPVKPGTDGQSRLRRLGKTGLFFSPVGFGAQHTRDADLIRYALDHGVNHIETSWLYGMGGQRSSCKCIGQAIAGRRDSVCLAVAYEAAAKPTSKAWLANQFEQTLRDLGTDHIDIFLWHHPGGGTINNSELTLKESQALVAAGQRVDLMLKWKNEGRFRWCGITTHSEQAEWLQFVAESKLYDVAVVAFNYNSPKGIAEAMQEASGKGIGLIAMKTQSPNFVEKAVLGDAPDHAKALNWVLSKNYITAAIPGMTTRSQVELNLKIMSLTG